MKRIVILIFAVIIVLGLVSCNTNSLEEYKNAAKKTDEIKKGQALAEFSLNMNFNSEVLTEEEIKSLNYIENMKGTFNAIYDEEEEKGIYKNYMNFGGLGYDFDIYENGDDVIIKLPIVGKYVNVNQIKNSTTIEHEDFEKEIISNETKEEIMKTWIGLMNEEDVFKGKDIILTTPDGEVKTTEYTINLTNEQIKMLATKCVEIISKDNSLKQTYEKYIKMNLEDQDYISFEEIINNIKDNIDIYSVEGFNYTALVDIDGYIVSENINFELKAIDPDFVLEKIDYNLDIKNWNINKSQDFDFPVVTEENLYNIDDFDENMPNVVEDFLKNN